MMINRIGTHNNGQRDFKNKIPPYQSVYTPISDSARNQHATTYPSNPHFMDISSLHRMMTNLTAVTKKLKKEAAVSEQKLRKDAEQNLAAAEQKLRDEAHEIREDAAHMEERLSKDLSALKAALATANKEH